MKRILGLSALLAVFTFAGAVGLYLLEDDYSFFDALYMSVITLSTVGYRELHELSTAGRVFIMGFLIIGLGVFLYCIATLGELMISNQFRVWMKKRQMDTKALSENN